MQQRLLPDNERIGLFPSTHDHAKQIGENLPTFIPHQPASFSLKRNQNKRALAKLLEGGFS